MDGSSDFIMNNNDLQNGIYVNGNGLANTDGTSFILAPGAERQSAMTTLEAPTSSHSAAQKIDPTKVVMDYSSNFPKLPEVVPPPSAGVKGAWGRQPAIQSTLVTEPFKLSANERSSRGLKTFGKSSDEQQKCNQVASATGTKIELCEAKDQSLTILITGKRQNVEDAKTRLVRELQTQASIEVPIPKEHHGKIIGKEGSNLRALEQEFFCRIFMPGRDEKGGAIKIVGPNEFIVEAARKIREISNEMAKQGSETLNIPRAYYPWIRGPHNQNIDSIMSRMEVKVNVPPSHSKNETIIVTGKREDVDLAVREILAIYETKKDFKMLTCIVPKAQHRFIIGQKRAGIDEILRETDIIVDVPAEEDDSDTINLRGPQEKLSAALALVYSKASSVIIAEIKYSEWMRRYLIGPKGSKLQSLIPSNDRLKVDFEDGGMIYIEGPPEAVRSAQQSLLNEITRLEKEMASDVVRVAPNLHRHIIGRNGTLVNKMKEENDVQISIPDEKFNSSEIRIQGKKDGVEKVRKEILEIVTRLENEKSRDIIIPHRFHGQIIGKSGESIQKWLKECPTLNISFPEATEKCDVVNIRGEKKEVDKLFAVLTKLSKELELSNYQDTVSIFKDYYKHIIGKNGSNISKIREETQTRIELPPSGPDGRITVIGKQENVEKAIAQLNKIQNELANIVTTEVNVPSRLHIRLLSSNRRLIRDIEDEFGGVHIVFPKEKSSDTVVIRGPKEDVAKAEVALKELSAHCEQTTEEVKIATKPEYIKFMIGREGVKVKKLRDKYPSVRIIFPNDSEKESQILLIGKREEVMDVKKIYQQQIAELSEMVEIQMKVEQKWHRHFIIRGAEVLKEIQLQNGNCLIMFPRQDSNETTINIKGSKSCVESAKAQIEEIVSDLEAQVTINICIPEEHHRSLISHLKDIRSKYNVKIKIPDRGTTNDSGPQVDGICPADLIQITGRAEKCEAVKEVLMQLVPITETITIPLEYHSSFIGRQGESVKALMNNHAVRIKIPPAKEVCDEINVSGTPDNVQACLAEIRQKLVEFDLQAEDRRLRSYKMTVEVPLKYHQRLLGQGGTNVIELGKRHETHVRIPRAEDRSETITVVGYEQKCRECIEEIQKMVDEWDALISYEVNLDIRFHPRLIGQRGKNLRKIEEEFGVEIRMPTRNSPNAIAIVVSGNNDERVNDCISHLCAQEEDFLNEMADRGYPLNTPSREANNQGKKEKESKGPTGPKVEITGAPWQLDSLEQFPVMGGPNGSGSNGTVTVAWGVGRR